MKTRNQFLIGFISAVVLVICTAQTTILYVTPSQATNVVVWVAYPHATNHVNYRFNNPQLTNAYLHGITTNTLMKGGIITDATVTNASITNSVLNNVIVTNADLKYVGLYGTVTNHDSIYMVDVGGPFVVPVTDKTNSLYRSGIDLYYASRKLGGAGTLYTSNLYATGSVSLLSTASTNAWQTLGVNSAGLVVVTNVLPSGTNYYSTNGGNGTTDYLVKWGNETNLTNSVIYDTGDPGIQVNGLARIQSDDNRKFEVTDAAGTISYVYTDHGTKTLKVNNGYFIDFASAGSGGVFSFNTTTQNASGYLKVYVGGGVQYIPTYSSP